MLQFGFENIENISCFFPIYAITFFEAVIFFFFFIFCFVFVFRLFYMKNEINVIDVLVWHGFHTAAI